MQFLDPKKATGPDKVNYKLLKISPNKIAKPLAIIFSKSLQQWKFPSSWKVAHVIPIFEKRGRFIALQLSPHIFIKLYEEDYGTSSL